MTDVARRRHLLTWIASAVVTILAGALLVRVFAASFSMGGDATATMWHDVPVAVDVTFSNGYDFPITVTDLRVTVRSVKAPHGGGAHRCTVDDFVVRQVSSKVKITVGARATSSLSSLHLPGSTWPHVGMISRSVNQHACQGAFLTLAYTASRTVKIL
jgi:hypothetical protein